ncbi:MAG: glycosyl hydrolase [Cyclobacteriaceae bacterium]
MKHLAILVLLFSLACQQSSPVKQLDHPEKSWVFWYWMKGAVSKPGITADLEAMKEVGLAGAYLMPIQGPTDPPIYEPAANQLTPEWWEMVRFAMEEAQRLGLELGMHSSDGFALAGGPWITPELSMQKVVWSETIVEGGKAFQDSLKKPEDFEGYYEDIAIYAFPNNTKAQSSFTTQPEITTSSNDAANFLTVEGNQEQFRCNDDCWFLYSFAEPFTCQSIQVITKGNNYQSHRLLVQVSQDGETFEDVYQMIPPRHGWQDTDAQVTYSIPKTTARYFRFQWKKDGTEPGAEDLDAAKWSPRLKIAGLKLSSLPKIHQFEGKTAEVWRISPRTTPEQLDAKNCISQKDIINLTEKLESNGVLLWDVPEGEWTILRMGHTSTGHTNYTGGGGLGLECDKFNPEAINIQFDGWYGQILHNMGSELTADVLKVFHIDSWECGSQNWSPVFIDEFKKRRSYNPLPCLPIMAGFPLNDTEFSEKFLYDIRQTISELTIDNFYGIMAQRAHENGVQFSAESVAPTMLSDGMRHYGKVDIPMGEFWLRSPTHDKPNDMMDAISGAHVYGKNIIQAEGFTELRMGWDEDPALIKPLLDRNYALGINRLFFHVYTHNPFTDRQPGVTLSDVGLYFQRDQTWWKHGAEFVKYTERCQKLLQEGKPVVDIAVFTGEGLPRRSILPDRLLKTLPGIFGQDVVEREMIRLKNERQPQRELPAGVNHSANMADPEDWLDPLNGYKYDSFNKDALLRLSSVNEGKTQLSTGAAYQMLVLPKRRKMDPNPEYLSFESLQKLRRLVEGGATLLISEKPQFTPGLDSLDSKTEELANTLWGGDFGQENGFMTKRIGQGRVIKTPIVTPNFNDLNLEPDFIAYQGKDRAENIAWTHRKSDQRDIYFVSNQSDKQRKFNLSLRVSNKIPEIYNPVTDENRELQEWENENGRTTFPIHLEANGSLFVILEKETSQTESTGNNQISKEMVQTLTCKWSVQFDPEFGGPKEPITIDSLTNWIDSSNPKIKYYSGTAIYETTFNRKDMADRSWLSLGEVYNIATVYLNDQKCGVAWTAPYEVEITEALKEGENKLRIAVCNTWRNRLIGDQLLPEEERLTWTTAPYRIKGEPLLDAGLLGPVELLLVK